MATPLPRPLGPPVALDVAFPQLLPDEFLVGRPRLLWAAESFGPPLPAGTAVAVAVVFRDATEAGQVAGPVQLDDPEPAVVALIVLEAAPCQRALRLGEAGGQLFADLPPGAGQGLSGVEPGVARSEVETVEVEGGHPAPGVGAVHGIDDHDAPQFFGTLVVKVPAEHLRPSPGPP